MRNVFNPLIVICFMLFSSVSYSLGFSNWSTVTEIVHGQGTSPTVRLSDMGNASTTCPQTGQVRFRNVDTNSGQRHFSMLLAALASGKQVRIKTDECSGDYGYIQYVYIRQ